MYPSVLLLCFPMSQSIFILSLCSPDDLQRRSLLVPSAPSVWSHYEPDIYLMVPGACMPACLDSCRAPTVACEPQRLRGSVRPQRHPCVCCTHVFEWATGSASECAVYYLTWGSKMRECKVSQVTYSVSWLLRRPVGLILSQFSISLNLQPASPELPVTQDRKTQTLPQFTSRVVLLILHFTIITV